MEFLDRMWLHIMEWSPLTIVITSLMLLVIFILWYETYKQTLDWRDLITNPATNRVSLTKLLQLVGGVVGTWIMVFVTLHDKLSAEIFFTYLAYVGAIEGWSKFITAKYGAGGDFNRPYNRPQIGGRYGQGAYGNSRYDPESGYDRLDNHPIPSPTAKPPIGDDI